MSNKARIREEAKKLNPIDDLMFRTMAEDEKFCEEILRVILGDAGLTVLESTAQYTGTNLQGRSVILDAKCVLGDGRKIDIEVQRADDDDHQKRVRYNGAVLTANITDPGTKFKDVTSGTSLNFVPTSPIPARNLKMFRTCVSSSSQSLIFLTAIFPCIT